MTNASERGYQIAFCQLLAAEGEELLYIATHGPSERGKDVITRGVDGRLRAYQLKGGKIGLTEWRYILPQLEELVRLKVDLPKFPVLEEHLPFLVTNGRVHDTVLEHLSTANKGWSLQHNPLTLIEGAQLTGRFLRAHRAFLPKELEEFQSLLALLSSDGSAPLDKKSVARFLESVVLLTPGAKKRDVLRSVTSAILLMSYILGNASQQSNHWAIFEGWTLMASYVLATATRYKLAKKSWKPSYDLAMLGADSALEGLVAECTDRKHFVEGHVIADGFFYGARQTIIAGLLSAHCLKQRKRGVAPDEAVRRLILERLKERFVWGESAAPFILISALELEQECLQGVAEAFIADYLQFLLRLNHDGMVGLPSSYLTIENSIRLILRNVMPFEIRDADENHCGFSGSCQVVIDYLARRWCRRPLASAWKEITRLSLESSLPQFEWEWFFWKSESAIWKSEYAGQPQSWTALIDSAETRDCSNLPHLMRENPDFLLNFLLVFPHRLTPPTALLLERACRA